MKLLADFQKFNFFRTPDWRWQRVLQMVDRDDTPGKSSRRDDEYTKRARNFTLCYRNRDDEEARNGLWYDEPHLYYAYQLHSKMQTHPEGALFVQARLLAKQSHQDIAKHLTTCAEAIQWYERLYFDVTPYLHCRDWVTAQVLIPAFKQRHQLFQDTLAGPRRDPPIAETFLDASLKLFAYFGGPHLVDFLIQGLQAGRPLVSLDDLSNWLDNQWSTTVRRRSLQAAFQCEINKYNVMELFAVHTRIMEIERSEESQNQQKTTTERHIQAMLDAIPWTVGDQGAEQREGTALARLDKMPGELRDDEVLRIASGQTVPGLADHFPSEIPPPRKRRSALEDKSAVL